MEIQFTKADKSGTRFALDEGQPQDVKEGMAELNVPKNQSIALICPFVKEQHGKTKN